MTTLLGVVEKIADVMGYAEAALAWLPGTDPRVAKLRALFIEIQKEVAINEVQVALAEVEAAASAKAQEIADAWPDEPTRR